MPVSTPVAKIILIAALLCSCIGGSVAAEREGADKLRIALQRDVEFLSDSICTGRKTGTPGATEAAFYLIGRLQELGYDCSVQSFSTTSGQIGRNIIARKASPRRSAVLLMAYYDGLGCIGDRFYPGADANASGVAALLCFAQRLKDRDDVIVAFVDAHNTGGTGADALQESLRTQTLKLVVNFDILGSTLAPPDKYWKNYLIILGGERWRPRFTNLNYGIDLHLYYDYYGSRSFTDLFYRKVSDHRVFFGRGIPVVMFTSGITLSTNRESDTSANLDYSVFAQRVELITKWLESM